MAALAVPEPVQLFQCDIDPAAVPLSRSRIARVLGYAAAVPEPVAEAMETVMAAMLRHCRPMGGFRLLGGEAGPEGFSCGGSSFATGPEIARQLDRAERFALIVATVGAGFDQLRRDYQEEPLLGYILDTAGSEWADRVADRVEQEVRSLAQAEGLAISNRYSPGYCGWNVAGQHQLFAMLPEGFCGVSVNAAAMMHPIKSISGVIGVGQGMVHSAYRCDLCNLRKTCRGRSQSG